MRCGVYVPNYGEYAEPSVLVWLAQLAEGCGWEGFFVWDHILDPGQGSSPVADAWTALAAIAAETEEVRLGPLVTPLARRRPHVVARQSVTLDRLSDGRLILGVGLGDPPSEFSAFGESSDMRRRARLLDEGLSLLVAYWSGKPVHHPRSAEAEDAHLLPRPLQEPRIMIWVAGRWPPASAGPVARAASWDGFFPVGHDFGSHMPLAAPALADARNAVLARRTRADHFDLVHAGVSTGAPGSDRDLLLQYQHAGVTWWLELFEPRRGDIRDTARRIRAGPPC